MLISRQQWVVIQQDQMIISEILNGFHRKSSLFLLKAQNSTHKREF